MKRISLCLLLLTTLGCRTAPAEHLTPKLLGAVNPNKTPLSVSYGNGGTLSFDPANTSTCASDTVNNCLSATCGTTGIGPCATYGGLVAKWGTVQPYFTSDTILNQVSAQTGHTDWIVFDPFVGPGAHVMFQGASRGTLIGTGTLNTVTAQNIVVTSGQDLQSTFNTTSPTAIGNLVVNTTRGSQAWTTYNPSGSTWALSEPLLSAAPPLNNTCGFLASDAAWASGNSVTIYSVGGIGATVSEIKPTFLGTNGDAGIGNNQLVIWRVGFTDPTGNAAPVHIGPHVQLLEDYIPNVNGATLDVHTDPSAPTGGIVNAYLGGKAGQVIVDNGLAPVKGASNKFCLYGGGVFSSTTNAYVFSATAYGAIVDGEFEAAGATADALFYGNMQVVATSDFNGADLWLDHPYISKVNSEYNVGPHIWGARPPILVGSRTWLFDAVTATTVFLAATGGLDVNVAVNTTGTACSVCGTTGTTTTTCGIPLTGANLAAACGDAGFGNYAEIPGTGNVQNIRTYPSQ